jgi:hypothetical protein
MGNLKNCKIKYFNSLKDTIVLSVTLHSQIEVDCYSYTAPVDSTGLHSYTTQTTALFKDTAVRTLNPTYLILVCH